VLNVTNNAFDAMRDKAQRMPDYAPTLRVTTRDVGDMFEIVVRDDGTGIPDHVLDRVFIPFFTTKPPGTNTGLGMSVCHEIIVQEHKGALSLDTRWGEFTEVTMRIPKTESAR
jgi:signal transduction histidine kinase